MCRFHAHASPPCWDCNARTFFHITFHEIAVCVGSITFGLNFTFLCFGVWECMMIIMSLEQRKVTFKPRIKLNHNICEQDLIIVTVSGGRFIEYGRSGCIIVLSM